MDSKSFSYWRIFFGCSSTDIFLLAEKALFVALLKDPSKFSTRRNRYVQILYNAHPKLEHFVKEHEFLPPEQLIEWVGNNEGSSDEGKNVSNENVVTTSDDEAIALHNRNQSENCYTYAEANALPDKGDKQLIVNEVLRIKGLLDNWKEESENVLFESLKRLQLMGLSIEILGATGIARAVRGLLQHYTSNQITTLAQILVRGWRLLSNEQEHTFTSFQEKSNHAEEDDGLPIPSLDKEYLLATQTTSVDPLMPQLDRGKLPTRKEKMKRQESAIRSSKPKEPTNKVQKPMDSLTWLVPGKPSLQTSGQKPTANSYSQKRQEPADVRGKPSSSVQHVSKQSKKSSDQDKIEVGARTFQARNHNAKNATKQHRIQMEPKHLPKHYQKLLDKDQVLEDNEELCFQKSLEASKRKLQERYQEAKEKRRRSVQVLDLKALPKRGQKLKQSKT